MAQTSIYIGPFKGIDQNAAQEFTASGTAYDALNIDFEDGNLKTAKCGKRAGYAILEDQAIIASFTGMLNMQNMSFFEEQSKNLYEFENMLLGINHPGEWANAQFVYCENGMEIENNVFKTIPGQSKKPIRINDCAAYCYNSGSVMLVSFAAEEETDPVYAIIRISAITEVA
jgi:hypothetical protein